MGGLDVGFHFSLLSINYSIHTKSVSCIDSNRSLAILQNRVKSYSVCFSWYKILLKIYIWFFNLWFLSRKKILVILSISCLPAYWLKDNLLFPEDNRTSKGKTSFFRNEKYSQREKVIYNGKIWGWNLKIQHFFLMRCNLLMHCIPSFIKH